MNSQSLTINFQANTSQAVTGISQINSEINRLKTNLNEISGLSDQFNRAFNDIRRTRAFDNQIKGTESLIAAQNKLIEQQKELSKSNTDSGNPYQLMIQGATDAAAALGQVQAQVQKLNSETDNDLGQALRIASKESIGFSANLRKLESDFKKVDNIAERVAKSFRDLDRQKKIEISVTENRTVKETVEKAVAPEFKKADEERKIREDNQAIKFADRQRKAREKLQGITDRQKRDAAAEKILRDLKNESENERKAKKVEENKRLYGSDFSAGYKSDQDYFVPSDAAKKQRQRIIDQQKDQERQNRAREQQLNRERGFGSSRNREDFQSDEFLKQANQKAREARKQQIRDRINELENQVKEREQRKKDDDQIRRFQRQGGQYEKGGIGSGFGINTLKTSAQAKADRPGILSSVGSFGLNVIERRSPQGLQDVIEGTQALSEAFGGSRLAALALGGAISIGLVGAFAAATTAVNYLSKALSEGMRTELEDVGNLSELRRITGSGSPEDIRRFNVLTELAGRDTSVEGNDIRKNANLIYRQRLQLGKDLGQSTESVQKETVDLATRFSVLAQTTDGVTPFQVQNALSSAVSGDLSKAVNRQEFFRNSGLDVVIKQTSQEFGINLSNATLEEQKRILDASIQKIVPDSLLKDTQATAAAQISKVNDILFAENTGIFGVKRDLDLDTEGVQSVYSEFAESIKLLFGDDGLFAEIGQLGDSIGIDLDVMKDVRSGFQTFNTVLRGFVDFLRDINNLIEELRKNPITKNFFAPERKEFQTGLQPVQQSSQLSNIFSIATGGINAVPKVATNVLGDLWNTVTGLFARPSYDGFIPLKDAIATELANKPSGSDLIIANSSETVLKPDQLAQMMSSTSYNSSSSSRVINLGGVHITQSKGESAEQLADRVIEQLNAKFEFESNSQL